MEDTIMNHCRSPRLIGQAQFQQKKSVPKECGSFNVRRSPMFVGQAYCEQGKSITMVGTSYPRRSPRLMEQVKVQQELKNVQIERRKQLRHEIDSQVKEAQLQLRCTRDKEKRSSMNEHEREMVLQKRRCSYHQRKTAVTVGNKIDHDEANTNSATEHNILGVRRSPRLIEQAQLQRKNERKRQISDINNYDQEASTSAVLKKLKFVHLQIGRWLLRCFGVSCFGHWSSSLAMLL